MTSCLFVAADKPQEENCSKWNCVFPANAINKLKPKHSANVISIEQFCQNNEDTQKLVNASDIVIVERNYFQDTTVISAFWSVRGKPIIGIFDDAYNLEEKDNASYSFWKYGRINRGVTQAGVQYEYMNPHPLVQFKMTLGLFRGLQLVSKKLCEDWSPYTKTYYVPNYLTLDRYNDARPLYPTGDKVVIGWAGSLNHLEPFKQSGLIDALEIVLEKYPQTIFMVGGDQRVFDAMSKFKYGKRVFHPFVPETQYKSLLKNFSIALAPLATPFDQRRSRVKLMEYGLLKIPFIATDMEPYDDYKFTGNLIKNSKENWIDALSERIENLSKYQEQSNTSIYDFTLSLDIDRNIEKTLEIYQHIINSPYPDRGVL